MTYCFALNVDYFGSSKLVAKKCRRLHFDNYLKLQYLYVATKKGVALLATPFRAIIMKH